LYRISVSSFGFKFRPLLSALDDIFILAALAVEIFVSHPNQNFQAYLDGRVRCPWHGACFSVKTGDIEDFPGMDSLPCFEARLQGDDIVVRADRDQIKSSTRTRGMCHAAPADDKRVFVIVGGGAAGAVCAQTLRELNFKGRVVVITKEEFLPYDRPKLSKAMNAQIDKILLRPREFYEKWNIEFLLKTEVTELDADTKTIKFANGNAMSFDACLVATGGACVFSFDSSEDS
jgi:apoptosis-inducing factor 3